MDSDEDELKSILCFCQGVCPYGLEYGTCQTKPGGKCFTSVELDMGDDGKEHPVLLYGCLPPNEMALFQCRSTHQKIKCCDEYDFCNKHLLPIIEKANGSDIDYFHGLTVKVLMSSIAVCLLFFMAAITMTYFKIRRDIRQRAKQDAELPTVQFSDPKTGLNMLSANEENSGATANSNVEATNSELVERTISKQITFELMISSGKYSEVWRAKWRGEEVAVKIYNQQNEQTWMREVQIFLTPLLRHEHILGYIAADVNDCGPNSKMYIITEYHNNGSLRDYLKHHSVNPGQVLQMTKGLASGLNYLHTEIIGSHRKPCITHNNINSTNILVKKDRSCCFSDFTNATRSFSSQNRTDAPNNIENTEFRYLAPEYLENKFIPDAIESYKMGDVYSFSLILWEILSRCELDASISDTKYQLPYEEELLARNAEHSLENVFGLVAFDKVRPQLKGEWKQNLILKSIEKVMVECWNATPSVRLTCLRIKKTLFKLYEEHYVEPAQII